MTIMEAIALVVTALVVPYVVALIRNEAITGSRARWLAIGVSVLAGIVAAFVGGVPTSPAEVIECVFAAVGGVQVTYTAFRSIGVTSKWLDALMEIGTKNDIKTGGTD